MKKIGTIRKSQIIGIAGSGAIVDFPGYSCIVSGIDHWKTDKCSEAKEKNFKIEEPNLSKVLNKKYFIQPFSFSGDKSDKHSNHFYVPVYLFPTFYYCPKCHKLTKFTNLNYDHDNKIYKLDCPKCNIPLIPSRFIVGCLNGHLDDFPYLWWIQHGKNGNPNCEIEEKEIIDNNLKMDIKGDSGGLESIVVMCTNKNCQKYQTEGKNCFRSLAGCMSSDALKGYSCTSLMPWFIYKSEDGNYYFNNEYHKTKQSCKATVRTMQRTANNVYYPIKVSALTIPPVLGNLNDFLNNDKEAQEKTDKIKANNQSWQDLLFNELKIKETFHLTQEAFLKAVNLYLDNKEKFSIENIVKDEYIALTNTHMGCKNFKTTTEKTPTKYKNYIKQVKLVKRLREVSVLKGFRRILPEIDEEMKINQENGIIYRENDVVPIAYSDEIDWLPAVEMFGEGIFIEFKQEEIDNWGKRIQDRYKVIIHRMNNMKFDVSNGMYSVQYILLHTFAHLLIRQLTYSCGYNTSAIKEKIYSTYNNDIGFKMAGILIYTAATDCDGSLGGLVRAGRTRILESLIDDALQNAYWCSNDPICIESKAQGYESLNYAACHACALLPETSCVSLNCLLDRAAIVGTPENREISFFKDIFEKDV